MRQQFRSLDGALQKEPNDTILRATDLISLGVGYGYEITYTAEHIG
jgi:hypothetical protein